MDVNVSNICFAPTSKPEVLLSCYRYQIGRQTKLLLNRKKIFVGILWQRHSCVMYILNY